MRVLFLATIVVLLQLFTYAMARGGSWWLSLNGRALRWWMLGCFVVSNVFLLGLFVGAFRLTLGYMSVLWLLMMAMAASAMLHWCLKKAQYTHADRLTKLFAPLIFVGLLASGVYHAYMPVVRHLSIYIDKPMPVDVRLAVASDLHLGALVGTTQLDRLTDILAQQSVDVLLMPGDIMDDDVKHYDRLSMQRHFAEAVAQAGTAAVATLGNHDLYQVDAQASIADAIRNTGAILLDDKVTTLAVQKGDQTTHLTIVGRIDDHWDDRMATADLMAMADVRYPVILLDHRPTELRHHSTLPIDLQVSGHTHNGQIFPANFIVDAINHIGYGYEKLGDMHAVVTSGFGFWGVPLRLGSRSEVWIIDVTGQKP